MAETDRADLRRPSLEDEYVLRPVQCPERIGEKQIDFVLFCRGQVARRSQISRSLKLSHIRMRGSASVPHYVFFRPSLASGIHRKKVPYHGGAQASERTPS